MADKAEINYSEHYSGKSALDLVKSMGNLREVKESLEAQLTEINKEYDYLRITAIPNKFDEDGIENLTVDGVGRVSLAGDMYVSIPSDMREEAYEYIDLIGKGDVITRSINSSTLKAMVKAMIKAGDEIPPMIKVTPFTRASITKR